MVEAISTVFDPNVWTDRVLQELFRESGVGHA